MTAGSPPHPDGEGVVISVRVVPGASRDQIVGPHGEALKVRVSAPPEGGRANRALCALLAAALDVPVGRIAVISGASSRLKRVRIDGLDPAAVHRRLGLADTDAGR